MANATANVVGSGGTVIPVDVATQSDSDVRQIVVVGDGATASTQTVDSTGSAAVTTLDVAASGSITVVNSNLTGAATANSSVATGTLTGKSRLTLQVTGTYTGNLTLQGTVDGSTWVSINGNSALMNVSTGVMSTQIPSGSVGIWTADIAGYAAVRVSASSTVTGTAVVTLRTSNGSGNAFGVFGTGTNTLGNVALLSRTTGGATQHTLISAATTNATSVKASAGTVYGISATNSGAAAAYLKLYNKASAPTVGTDVAVKTILIPPGATVSLPISPVGLNFGTGIAYAITGAATTADTTAVALAQCVVNIDYA